MNQEPWCNSTQYYESNDQPNSSCTCVHHGQACCNRHTLPFHSSVFHLSKERSHELFWNIFFVFSTHFPSYLHLYFLMLLFKAFDSFVPYLVARIWTFEGYRELFRKILFCSLMTTIENASRDGMVHVIPSTPLVN